MWRSVPVVLIATGMLQVGAGPVGAVPPGPARPVAGQSAGAQPAGARTDGGQQPGVGPAAARPVAATRPARAVPALLGPTRACTITDDRLDEISGLVATGSGYIAIDDGSDLASHRKIFYLNRDCAVTRTVSYPSRPRDTEDLALAADGTLWVADIGDNDRARQTVALWRLGRGARTPVLYRLTYPDRAHDAEALLVTGDGVPVIVTKDPVTAGVYAPAGPLRAGATVPMTRVGRVRLPSSRTSNPFSFAGRMVITGAAVSPGGDRVVLRTYADAFEFDVTGGDVVKAVTEGTPRAIPLPDEPQGESVTYSPDGTALLTVSETAGQAAGTGAKILRYALPVSGDAGAGRSGESGATSPPAGSAAAPNDTAATGAGGAGSSGSGTEAGGASSTGSGHSGGVGVGGALLFGVGGALALFLLRRRAGR